LITSPFVLPIYLERDKIRIRQFHEHKISNIKISKWHVCS
jgi:hypothetical protein